MPDRKIASLVFLAFYITYVFMLLSSLLCNLARIKIPYLLLTFLTLCTFTVIVVTVYLGFTHFQSKSSLVFIALYGTINAYIWTLAYYFAPLQEEEEDLGADIEILLRGEGGSDSSSRDSSDGAPFLTGSNRSDRLQQQSAGGSKVRKTYEVKQFSLPIAYA